MSSFWRAAGLTYVNYSSIAARVTRKALKSDAAKVNINNILGLYSKNFIFVSKLSFKSLFS